MKKGAIAMIDALGFKGIWARQNSKELLNNMSLLKKKIEQDIKDINTQSAMQFEVAFLSDTIVIALSLNDDSSYSDALSIIYVTDIIGRTLNYSLRSNTPLAYRGAVGYGEYELGPHFIIGKAVDETATYHESAQAAITWLLPKAREIVAAWLSGRKKPANTHLVSCEVPLKNGDNYRTYTVSPIVQSRNESDANGLVASLLKTFDSSPVDIAVKRQNTVKHLESCYTWRGWKFPYELYPFDDLDRKYNKFQHA